MASVFVVQGYLAHKKLPWDWAVKDAQNGDSSMPRLIIYEGAISNLPIDLLWGLSTRLTDLLWRRAGLGSRRRARWRPHKASQIIL